MPVLLETVATLRAQSSLSFILATPKGFATHAALQSFREPLSALSIKVITGETWDCIGHADLALAASGTVTIEAAVLGTPMVTFYKVNPLSWDAGRRLVKVPFLSMVNLVAGRRIVPEFIQQDMTALNISGAARELLSETETAERMRTDLAEVRLALSSDCDPLERAAAAIASAIHAPSAQSERGWRLPSGDNK